MVHWSHSVVVFLSSPNQVTTPKVETSSSLSSKLSGKVKESHRVQETPEKPPKKVTSQTGTPSKGVTSTNKTPSKTVISQVTTTPASAMTSSNKKVSFFNLH